MNHSISHDSSSPSAATAARTALVLGGGGSAGNAWLIGILAGLSDAGTDVTDADLVVGTSAGATTAAQIVHASPGELFAATLAPVPARPGAPGQSGRRPAAPAPNQTHIDNGRALAAAASDIGELRRRRGEWAIEADPEGARTPQWRDIVAQRLPSGLWPHRRLHITAVDARTGEPVVLDRDSGVDLVDAVAASCSSGFAYRIGDGRYIDGGFRSNAENADLARGHSRVLVLAPFGGRTLLPTEWRVDLAAQVDALRSEGSTVETVFPDGAARDIFADGGNVMDPSARAVAAQAGHTQGQALADRVGALWL